MYDTVLDALRRGAADEALAAAQSLAEQQPDDLRTLRLLASAQRLSGDTDAAMATLDGALARYPEDADLHLERAGLLLQSRDLSGAETALAQSIGLDPNQFPAYIIQAQLAMGRGELDEADRLVRTAARIAPDHPQLKAVEGLLALRRGRPDEALALVATASAQAPDEPLLRYALGAAYLAKEHLAFAEQAFRGVLETSPDNLALRSLVANIVRRQGRPAEAADELAPLLDDGTASPAMHRLVGELELAADRTDAAVPRLKRALALMPGDRRTLAALIEAWQRRDDQADARGTLDAALATHPQLQDLWLARLGVETFAGDEARAVIDRWLVAMPDYPPALMARVTVLDALGDTEGAEAAAHRVVEVQPGHTLAEMRLLDGMMKRDPAAAVTRLHWLLERVQDPDVARALRQLLGFAHDRADQPAEAVATWLSLHAEAASIRITPPPATGYTGPWPERAPRPDDAPITVFMWGAPGSMIERLTRTIEVSGGPILQDRIGPNPPADPLQRMDTPRALVDGTLDGAYLAAQWRAALPGRGARPRVVFDWLPFWDNAYALALRPHIPEAGLLIALRDPRDMLVDWLAFGSPAPLRVESAVEAARWLAGQLEQVAEIEANDVVPYRTIRLDDIHHDNRAIAQAMADALDLRVPIAPEQAYGPTRLPRDHWRRFAGVLDEAFAILAPVAARLGYTA
ncbi:tetratricopeptide repeat protein [Cognatilysobacter terrigena]|uniref:tetratricopeptide repeat protein n=1 Tax=Cognatilysobacter terrigena TaxID=2488749 RepID=UPI0014150B4D|nr:tetratricopeptide repeat protein [Lysobacter terrigena]